jgi:hypothetical protein
MKKIIISENQIDKLRKPIQTAINLSVSRIKSYVDDMDMDEISAIFEISSVNRVVVDRIESTNNRIKVFVDIYTNTKVHHLSNYINELDALVSEFFPMVTIIENEIINEATFGPGIDW